MRWFAGPEFDWLDKQVEASLWRGDVVAPRKPPAQPKASGVPPLPPKVRYAVAPTLVPGAMSVDEYNRWRGTQAPTKIDALPYVHQDYPKWIYHPSGERKVVATLAEHRRYLTSGWRDTP